MADQLIKIRVLSVEDKGKHGIWSKQQSTAVIEVTSSLLVWQVRREVQEIRNLSDKLRSRYGRNVPILETPTGFFAADQKSTEEIKDLVEKYLQSLTSVPVLADSADWSSFLIPSLRALLSQPRPSGGAEHKGLESSVIPYKGSSQIPSNIDSSTLLHALDQILGKQREAYLEALTQQRTDFLKSMADISHGLAATGVRGGGGGGHGAAGGHHHDAKDEKEAEVGLNAVIEYEKMELSTWKCKHHNQGAHDIFINYRVRTDKDTAEKIFLYLSGQKKQDGTNVTVFFDKYCLQDGEDWEVGFLNGLQGASLIVLLISEDGIQQIRDADKRQDNVLLEYEYALDKYEKGEALLFPMLLGKEASPGVLKKFSAFDTSCFPDATHHSRSSTKNVRATMSHVFKLQGSQTDPSSFVFNMPALLRVLDRADSRKASSQINKVLISRAKIKNSKHCDVNDIQEILDSAKMSEYSDVFRQYNIDGPLLVGMFAKDTSQQSILLRKLRRFLLQQEAHDHKEEETPKDQFLKYLRSLPSNIKAKDCFDQIADGMRNFSKEAAVQIEALNVIALLTGEEDKQANRDYIMSKQGADLVIDTVTAMKDNPVILETGFNAMAGIMLSVMLSVEYEGFNEKSAALIFVRKGGIPLAIHGMKENEGQLPLIKAGLMTLFYFSMNNENCKHIIEEGGLGVTLDIMKKYPDLILLQESGMYVISNLAANSPPELQKILGESGAVEAITKAVKRYDTIPKLAPICGLSCIAEYPVNRKRIAANGWIPVLKELFLQKQSEISQFHFFIIRLLGKMTKTNEGNQRICFEQNVMNTVVDDIAKWCEYLPIPEPEEEGDDEEEGDGEKKEAKEEDGKENEEKKDRSVIVSDGTKLSFELKIQLEKIYSELMGLIISLIEYPQNMQAFIKLKGPQFLVPLNKRFEVDTQTEDEYELQLRTMNFTKNQVNFYCDIMQHEIKEKISIIYSKISDNKAYTTLITKLEEQNPGLVRRPVSAGWWFCEECKHVEFALPDPKAAAVQVVLVDDNKDGFVDEKELKAMFSNAGECKYCKSTHTITRQIRIEPSEFEYTLSKMEEKGEGPYNIGCCVCTECSRLEFPGCDHGILSVQLTSNSIRCRTCLSSTYNTAPWRIGCRWCQAPFIARACVLDDNTLLKQLRKDMLQALAREKRKPARQPTRASLLS